MNDDDLLLQASQMPTVYFDGFGAFRKINGVLRCVGYVIGGGAQMNLIISLMGAEGVIIEAKRALDAPAKKGDTNAERLRAAH